MPAGECLGMPNIPADASSTQLLKAEALSWKREADEAGELNWKTCFLKLVSEFFFNVAHGNCLGEKWHQQTHFLRQKGVTFLPANSVLFNFCFFFVCRETD